MKTDLVEIKLIKSLTHGRVEYLAGQTVKVDSDTAKWIVGQGGGQYPVVVKSFVKEGVSK